MMRALDALVMVLGFDPGPLVSAVASSVADGFSPGARIIVFTAGFPDERAERAWRQFQDVIGLMELPKRLNVKVERYQVPLNDFVEAVCRVKEIFEDLRELRVKISITGGMRALGIAVFLAYMLIDWKYEPSVEVYLEGRGMALKIPEVQRIVKYRLTSERLELLKAMKPGRVYKPSDLSGLLGKDRSTIYRQLQALVEEGFVERADGGYRLSRLGLLLV